MTPVNMKNIFFLFLIIILAAGLRLYNITSIPALNADEAALGYNAYSLLETGKDEHGESWPLVFKSFGDYKPGVYVYLVLLFVKLLGLNVLAVRLPGLILSVMSVWLVYLLAEGLIDRSAKENKYKIFGLLSALMLAISPWHIHFSRGAWETQVSIAFLLMGINGFLRGLRNRWWFLVWVVSFVTSTYTYHSMRVVVPLMGLGIVWIWRRELFGTNPNANLNVKNLNLHDSPSGRVANGWFWGSLVIGLVLMVPLGISLLGESGLSRASGVSILADSGPVWRVNEARGLHNDFNSVWVKLIHNKPMAYGLRFFDNYLRHFSGNFLFVDGDEIQRNKVPGFGGLYLVSLPFVLIGLWKLITGIRENKGNRLILWWLLIAPIPAAMTFQSPHALRAFSMVVPWAIITAVGIVSSMKYLVLNISKFKKFRFILYTSYFILTTLFFWDLGRYLFNYHRLMVSTLPFSSQYGFSELVTYLESVKGRYDRIYVTDRYDQPYILFLFYTRYPPGKFQNQAVLSARDEFGFSTVRNYDRYHFEQILDFNSLNSSCGHCLIVGTDEEIPDEENVVKEVRSVGGRVIFQIIES